MMTDDIDWNRIADHFAGRTSPAEQAEFGRWMSATRERRQLIATLEKVWDRSADAGERIDIDAQAAWQELRERLDGTVTTKTRSSWSARIAAVAAAVLLALGGLVLLRIGARIPQGDQLAIREVVTARGQRAELRLADGSRVVLGVDSKLRWSTKFGIRAREVSLEGEALFVVVDDRTRPFVVRSANAVIDDIGTEFGVRAYAGDGSVRVVVRKGAVALAPARDTLTHRALLGAGDMGSLDSDGAVRVEHDVDVERQLAFAEGRLEFTDATMSEVARALDRWYGLDLVVDDTALTHATVTASFGKYDEPSAVVRRLGRTLGARVEQEGRTVRFIALH